MDHGTTRRFTVALLALAAVVTLGACGSSAKKAATTTTASTTTTTTEPATTTTTPPPATFDVTINQYVDQFNTLYRSFVPGSLTDLPMDANAALGVFGGKVTATDGLYLVSSDGTTEAKVAAAGRKEGRLRASSTE